MTYESPLTASESADSPDFGVEDPCAVCGVERVVVRRRQPVHGPLQIRLECGHVEEES